VSTYPPPPYPPSPQPPVRRSGANVAVIVILVIVGALLALVAASVALGVALLHNVHVQTSSGPSGNRVSITTPVGRIGVNTSESAQDYGLAVYPGARAVTGSEPSAFSNDSNDRGEHRYHRAHVNVELPGVSVHVNVGEFDTAASPDDVLKFYRSQLQPYGNIVETSESSGETKLEVKSRSHGGDHDIVHAVAVKTFDGKTHFVLVNVNAGRPTPA
jgi:hypothetical protein